MLWEAGGGSDSVIKNRNMDWSPEVNRFNIE